MAVRTRAADSEGTPSPLATDRLARSLADQDGEVHPGAWQRNRGAAAPTYLAASPLLARRRFSC